MVQKKSPDSSKTKLDDVCNPNIKKCEVDVQKESRNIFNDGLTAVGGFLGEVKIVDVPPGLSEQDIEKGKKKLKAGDIVLVGQLGTVLGAVISSAGGKGGSAFTHAMIFDGTDFIDASKSGVGKKPISVLSSYDTMVIIRPGYKSSSAIERALSFARKQFGKGYDSSFEANNDSYYCSELVSEVLTAADLNSAQFSGHTIHPEELVKSGKTVFSSDNLGIGADGRFMMKSLTKSAKT